MRQNNGPKTESGKTLIKLPVLCWQLRILLYLFTLLSAVVSLAAVLSGTIDEAAAVAVYVIAGCGLVLSCCYLFQDVRAGARKVKRGIEANSFTRRVSSDYRYRTVLFAHSSLAGNLLFALSNGVFGMIYHSDNRTVRICDSDGFLRTSQKLSGDADFCSCRLYVL